MHRKHVAYHSALCAAHCQDIKLSWENNAGVSSRDKDRLCYCCFFLTLLPVLLNKRLQQKCFDFVLNVVTAVGLRYLSVTHRRTRWTLTCWPSVGGWSRLSCCCTRRVRLLCASIRLHRRSAFGPPRASSFFQTLGADACSVSMARRLEPRRSTDKRAQKLPSNSHSISHGSNPGASFHNRGALRRTSFHIHTTNSGSPNGTGSLLGRAG